MYSYVQARRQQPVVDIACALLLVVSLTMSACGTTTTDTATKT